VHGVRLAQRRRGRVRRERRVGRMFFVTLGIVGVTFVGAVAAFALTSRPRVCPSCAGKALRLVATRSMFVAGQGGSIERMYRCSACKAELMQRGKGAMIPRELWDRGERAELPPARLLDR